MLTVDEALEAILREAAPLPSETTSIEEAIGRALSSPVHAVRTLPPWDNSAMDGYAVRSTDVTSAGARLKIIETIYAGQTPQRTIGAGECARIMTGAPMPEGSD